MDSLNPFDYLPNELIVKIGVLQPINGICNFSIISTRISKLINNEFWRFKFLNDYESYDGIVCWKNAYQNYGLTFGFGDYEFLRFIPNPNEEYNEQNKDEYSEEELDENFRYPNLAPNHRFKSVACGSNFTLVIDLNDNVLAFGHNDEGQLGIGDINYMNEPILLSWNHESKAKFVTCGSSHSAIIDLEDNVWVFGDNSSGQLGLGDIESRNKPCLLSKAKFIACGYNHTMFIDLDDNVWVFGSNAYGQLGLIDTNRILIPTLLSHNIKAKSIACGSFYSMIIDLEDNVWSFGCNGFGQLGLALNQERYGPTQLLIKAKMVACGNEYTVLIDLEDNVWVFGCNISNQLGFICDESMYLEQMCNHIPNILTINGQNIKAKFIACGKDHTLLIDMNDNVISFGSNDYGELGIHESQGLPQIVEYYPEDGNFLRPIKARYVACGDNFSFILLHPNMVNEIPMKLEPIASVSCDVSFTEYQPNFISLPIISGYQLSIISLPF